ncbi:hypothetical protein SMCF_1886 [Streptomyces coelicoflavus ZG0656]|nr:hypothetical protein SMCF_1886 [Streptomyces coelicoflavus ZG0656]MZE44913.1 hypothetical protein [Streptomyces sp. SID5477]
MDEQRTALAGNKIRYAMSASALHRSADRLFWDAVAQHGDAAGRGDMRALDKINEASVIAGTVSAGAIGRLA